MSHSVSPKEKLWNRVAIVVTIVVVLIVGMMRRVTIPIPESWDFSMLPAFHALLNSIAAVLIILGGTMIKRGNKTLHRNFMMSAFAVSTLFLLSYITYHFTSGDTIYGDLDKNGILSSEEKVAAGSLRSVYLFILFTHIILAVVSFPLILFSIIAAVFKNFSKHKKLTKLAYPMWLYVAITGPVCFFMLKSYY